MVFLRDVLAASRWVHSAYISEDPHVTEVESVRFYVLDDPRDVTVVLDLDETLVFARHRRVVLRPWAREFVGALVSQNFEIIIWSAGNRDHVERCLAVLD